MIKRLLQLKTKKAESLVEVIMAIFIISMGSGVATSLIVSALQSNEFSRDNLIASNLAIEGIEAVREIRDANWLKFSFDRPGCWNMDPSVTNCKLPAPNPITPGNYTVDLDLTSNKYAWGMNPVGSTLSLPAAGSGEYLLSYYPLVAGGPVQVIASKNSEKVGFHKTGDTSFYRMITVAYPDHAANASQPATCDTTSGKAGCEVMDITSTVQWLSQGTVHSIVLSSELTDYQKIKVQI